MASRVAPSCSPLPVSCVSSRPVVCTAVDASAWRVRSQFEGRVKGLRLVAKDVHCPPHPELLYQEADNDELCEAIMEHPPLAPPPPAAAAAAAAGAAAPRGSLGGGADVRVQPLRGLLLCSCLYLPLSMSPYLSVRLWGAGGRGRSCDYMCVSVHRFRRKRTCTR